MQDNRTLSPGLKLAIEAGPLVVFFIANWQAGIFWGTGLFMAATLVSLGLSWLKTGKIAMMPLIGAGFVALFGALTLWLQDDTFIKVKVTLINGLFGSLLVVGYLMDRPFLKMVLGETLQMDAEGWRKLTLRWAIFFFAVGSLNEIIWRNFSTDVWVNFKVFGLLPLTFAFAIAQLPLMQRHGVEAPGSEG